MVKNGELVAIFNSVHRVMRAEKLLKQARLPMLLIPVPRELTSDCGLAIRYAAADRPAIEEALATAGLVPEEIHLREGGGYRRL